MCPQLFLGRLTVAGHKERESPPNIIQPVFEKRDNLRAKQVAGDLCRGIARMGAYVIGPSKLYRQIAKQETTSAKLNSTLSNKQ